MRCFAARYVSNRFTMYMPKSRCSHRTSISAPCITLTMSGSAKMGATYLLSCRRSAKVSIRKSDAVSIESPVRATGVSSRSTSLPSGDRRRLICMRQTKPEKLRYEWASRSTAISRMLSSVCMRWVRRFRPSTESIHKPSLTMACDDALTSFLMSFPSLSSSCSMKRFSVPPKPCCPNSSLSKVSSCQSRNCRASISPRYGWG
mmetsp:Transcript_39094/g.117525  ORF Transcript_39094/g.117525 Transcript_39094/m.117525 type:complete len:203 (-) Transcript_39094:940-1548(-)